MVQEPFQAIVHRAERTGVFVGLGGERDQVARILFAADGMQFGGGPA
ncbi:hypothetical protein [Jongsikchunia kroppenstedtii]|nr:hypothetical protein [Jongsikchunia kroppenstedtii]